jgi:hypothetical protein
VAAGSRCGCRAPGGTHRRSQCGAASHTTGRRLSHCGHLDSSGRWSLLRARKFSNGANRGSRSEADRCFCAHQDQRRHRLGTECCGPRSGRNRHTAAVKAQQCHSVFCQRPPRSRQSADHTAQSFCRASLVPAFQPLPVLPASDRRDQRDAEGETGPRQHAETQSAAR